MSLFESASLVVTPNGTKASKLYAIKPTDGSGDLTVTRATTARRVNSAGLIESVAANVPRLDYTNSTCPSILVEPQRTNLLLRSEEFDNASWIKAGTNLPIVTANQGIAPDGNNTADRLFIPSSPTTAILFENIVHTSGVTYTISFYAKSNTISNQLFRLFGDTGTSISSNFTATDEWQRFSFTYIATASASRSCGIWHVLNTQSDILIWGAQLEAGAYATSYIPTTTASVTRNADLISKTGISSLIGQTEGTVFVDYKHNATEKNQRIFRITRSGGGFQNSISLEFNTPNNLTIFNFNAGVNNVAITSVRSINERLKIAIKYKENDFSMYINGQLIGTDNTCTIAGSFSELYLFSLATGQINSYANSAALWKTALTDQECINLTTI